MTEPIARSAQRGWRLSLLLIGLTLFSTTYVGAFMAQKEPAAPAWFPWPESFFSGLSFSLPLMAILMSHEFGHFLVGRRHGVDISPPYFIPVPFPQFLLGTMGAVINIREVIRSRNALLDIGAAGPLAGLVVALPVLVYGLSISPVHAVPDDGAYIIEGRSILYLGLIYALKGPIAEGYDVFLSPTAFAGWAGLLVTMINLVPVGQLDGGHIAYALFGPKQNAYGVRIRRALPWLGVLIGGLYGGEAFVRGVRGEALLAAALSGMHWVVWALVLGLMARWSGQEHPPTEPGDLGPKRRAVAWLCLLIFALLFMPSWVRTPV